MSKFCTSCGFELADDARFCPNCGIAIETESVKVESVPTPASTPVVASTPVEPTPVVNPTPVQPTPVQPTPVVNPTPVQPVPVANFTNTQQPSGPKVFSVLSFIFGLVSVLCCCLYWFSGIMSVAAVTFGILALAKKQAAKGMAITGLILGGLGIIILSIMVSGGNILCENIFNEIIGFIEMYM